MAFLFRVCASDRRAVATVVPEMRNAVGSRACHVPRLPAAVGRDEPRAVRLRRSRARGGPSAQVRWMVADRGRTRPLDGAGVGGGAVASPRRGDVGPALAAAPRNTGIRPGEGARIGGSSEARGAAGPAPASGGRCRSAGPPPRRGTAAGHAGPLCRGRSGERPDPAGRRCLDDRRDGRRLCRGPSNGRCRRRRAPHGVPIGLVHTGPGGFRLYSLRARVRVCGCPGERLPGSRCQPRAKRPT